MKFSEAATLCVAIICLFGSVGCGSLPDRELGTAGSDKPIYNQIVAEAQRLDRILEDGWIVGRDPRTFKSLYGKTSAEHKAHFAVDYAAMMAGSGQDLVNNWSSYLPYSTRAQFALKWWSKDPVFLEQEERKQNIWIHEALLDGRELYWRILERKENPGSAQVVAHDVEQNMVYKFMENDHCVGTWGDFRKVASSAVKTSQQ
jgi:hypothetical protein